MPQPTTEALSSLLARDGLPSWTQLVPYPLPSWPPSPPSPPPPPRTQNLLERFFGLFTGPAEWSSRMPATPTDGLADNGLYVSYGEAGDLQHVAAWENGKCTSHIYVDCSGPRGWYESAGAAGLGLAYYANGTMEVFHQWDNDSPPYPATLPFDAWVKERVNAIAKDEEYRREKVALFPSERAGRCRKHVYDVRDLVDMTRAGVRIEVVDLRPPSVRREHYPAFGALSAIPPQTKGGIILVLLESWKDETIDEIRAAAKRDGGSAEAICTIFGGAGAWSGVIEQLRRSEGKASSRWG